MKLRWSNGHSAAVEFEANRPEEMADAMCNALIEFRRLHGIARVELHVNVGPETWTDPSAVPLPGEGIYSATFLCHVINCNGRVASDPDDTPPRTRGTDYVLIVGPGAWHGPVLFSACMNSIRYFNALAGLGSDVADAILRISGEKQ